MTARYDLIEVAAQAMRALDYDEPWEYAHEAIRVAYRTEAAAALDALLAQPSLVLAALGAEQVGWQVMDPDERAWINANLDLSPRVVAVEEPWTDDDRPVFALPVMEEGESK